MTGIEPTSVAALDLQGLQNLKAQANADPKEALAAAAREFEGLMAHMMVKAMRATVPESGLTQSSQGTLYQELLDQQWAQLWAKQGMGLAEVLIGQLEPQIGGVLKPVSTQAALPQADKSTSAGE